MYIKNMKSHINQGDTMTMYYYGKEVPTQVYTDGKKLEAVGTCPFCNTTGFTAKYGSMKRHIISCMKK